MQLSNFPKNIKDLLQTSDNLNNLYEGQIGFLSTKKIPNQETWVFSTKKNYVVTIKYYKE